MGLFDFSLNRKPAVDPMHTLYGSSHLFDGGVDRLDLLTSPHGCNGVLMGVNALDSDRGAVWLPSIEQGHAFAFGATRNAKFTALLAPALLSWGGGMLVIDPKAESAWLAAERRRRMGQKVVILDPWGELQRRYGDRVGVHETLTRFNPLAHLDPASPDFSDDIATLADALIVVHGNETQPHFPEAARELVGGLIAAVAEWRPGFGTLGDVRRLVTASPDELATHIQFIMTERPRSVAAAKLRGFLTLVKQADGGVVARESNEAASVRSTARTQTAILDSLRLIQAMDNRNSLLVDSRKLLGVLDDTVDAFDMAELGTSRVSLFLVLPVDKLETHGRWMRLIVSLAIRAIARQAVPPPSPVLFCLDEMGTIGKLTAVEQAVGLLAGMGVRIWGFLQDLSQLQRDYPASWPTFLANASAILLMKCTEPKTTKYFSEYLGTKTIRDVAVSHSVSYSAQGASSSRSKSVNYHSRAVLLPEEIRDMPDEDLIFIRVGKESLRLKKAIYFRERRWDGLYRPNPNYPPPRPPGPPPLPKPDGAFSWWRWYRRPPPPKPLPAFAVSPQAKAAKVMVQCPGRSCGRVLRVPANRGRGWVTCPTCRFRWSFEAHAGG